MQLVTCLYCGNEVPLSQTNFAGYHCYPIDTSTWKNQADVQPLPGQQGTIQYLGYIHMEDYVNSEDIELSTGIFLSTHPDAALATMKRRAKGIILWRGYGEDTRVALNQLFIHVAVQQISQESFQEMDLLHDERNDETYRYWAHSIDYSEIENWKALFD